VWRLGLRSLSALAVILILILVSILGSLAIYFACYVFLGKMRERVLIVKGFIRVEAVKPGIGYVKLYIRSIDFEGRVDAVYFLDPYDYTLLAFATLPQPVEVSTGELVEVTVPLTLIEYLSASAAQALGVRVGGLLHLQPILEVLGKPVLIGVGSYSSNRIAILAISTEPINLAHHLRKATRALIGLLADRYGRGDQLRIDPDKIHYARINLVTGEYDFIYIDGRDVRRTSGRARVLKDTNVLDLRKLNWNERYKLGPVIIFINPHYATKDYEVTIYDLRENRPQNFLMRKLVDDKGLVGLDALVCWEDLWWPNTRASLDDYTDHVVRITVFTNDTIRIEIVHASEAGYLHAFFINPPPADKEKLQDLANQYNENGYRLPRESGVVYIKRHGTRPIPPPNNQIWDPVEGKWDNRWPIVFYG